MPIGRGYQTTAALAVEALEDSLESHKDGRSGHSLTERSRRNLNGLRDLTFLETRADRGFKSLTLLALGVRSARGSARVKTQGDAGKVLRPLATGCHDCLTHSDSAS